MNSSWSIILAVAAACYAMRVGGYFVMAFVPLPPRTIGFIEALPGPLLAALVFLAAANISLLAGAVAAIVSIAAANVFKNEIVAGLLGAICGFALSSYQ